MSPKSNLTSIYLVRHGDVLNPAKIIYGNLPLTLSSKGQEQAGKLGKYFAKKNISAIYTSPITRCRQTAALIADKLNLKIKQSQLLTESDWGVFWQGTPIDRMYQKFGADWHTYKTAPGELNYQGVTLETIAKRMNRFIKGAAKKHPGENIICVSHGDPVKALILELTCQSFNKLRKIKFYYGGVFVLKFSGSRFLEARLLQKGKGYLVNETG
ncbi:MAG TPA: histidine phosphatase family protein [Patescibacteria group bacterium]